MAISLKYMNGVVQFYMKLCSFVHGHSSVLFTDHSYISLSLYIYFLPITLAYKYYQ